MAEVDRYSDAERCERSHTHTLRYLGSTESPHLPPPNADPLGPIFRPILSLLVGSRKLKFSQVIPGLGGFIGPQMVMIWGTPGTGLRSDL